MYEFLKAIVIPVVGIAVPLLFVIRELRRIRIRMFYSDIMTLEKEITDETKDVWGIPPDNKFERDGRAVVVNLDKLQYMVRFLDTYVRSRAQMTKRKRSTVYKSDRLVYKLFQNEVYRDYWVVLVRDHFYVGGGFVTAIDNTINAIERSE